MYVCIYCASIHNQYYCISYCIYLISLILHIHKSYISLWLYIHIYIYIILYTYIHTHRIHVCYIYGNIYHQYTPFMLAYIPYMDPMGYDICKIYIYIHILLHRRISYFPVRHGTTVSLSETGAFDKPAPRWNNWARCYKVSWVRSPQVVDRLWKQRCRAEKHDLGMLRWAMGLTNWLVTGDITL